MGAFSHAYLKEIAGFLESRCGLVFTDTELPSLARKLEERLLALQCGSAAQYHSLITSPGEGAAELKELVNRVTIHETFFFRIPAHLRVFAEEMLPALAEARRAEKRLRVWSAGCSTGEEAYSLAIQALDSRLFNDWDVRIVGTDISEQVVQTARRGVYRGRTIQTVPAHLLKAFFDNRPDGYSVGEAPRALCEFQVHNLVTDLPPLPRFDVVFFRNVMIYFPPAVTRRIIDTLHRQIPDDGYLVIGPAETLWQLSDRFVPHYRGDCFIYRKSAAGDATAATPRLPAAPAPPAAAAAAPAAPLPKPGPAPRPAVPAEARKSFLSASERDRLKMVEDFLSAGGYPEAMNILETLPEDLDTLFLQCECLLSMGRYPQFLDRKDRLLERDPLHVEIRYLHALYLSNKGSGDAAREEIQKVLFTDEYLLQPRYTLMLLHERSGRKDQARQECRNLVRIVESGRGKDFRHRIHVRKFAEAEILRHCKDRLARG
ncbi:MAG: hypothetical protein KA419_08130 [Acidobacteria bacterium]|nr:hypothetical protein [Acidobacteriota bacterium]